MIENCDLEEGILLVRNKTAAQTGEEYRKVWLSDTLKQLILSVRRESGHIWLNSRGQPMKAESLVSTFRRLRKKLGLRDGITLYTYRHLWGSTAINNGADSVIVARAMGHKDTRMVMSNYFHEDDEAMRGREEGDGKVIVRSLSLALQFFRQRFQFVRRHFPRKFPVRIDDESPDQRLTVRVQSSGSHENPGVFLGKPPALKLPPLIVCHASLPLRSDTVPNPVPNSRWRNRRSKSV